MSFPERFETTNLLLRPLAPGDAPAIFSSYGQDPEVTRFLTWRPHSLLADAERYVAGCLSLSVSKSRTYALVGRSEKRLLGTFELRRLARHRISFGCVLARPYWGRGLMTEAVREVGSWALLAEDVWRFDGVCDIENVASARVLEKAGLAREGVLRRWALHPNISPNPRDCFSYAVVR